MLACIISLKIFHCIACTFNDTLGWTIYAAFPCVSNLWQADNSKRTKAHTLDAQFMLIPDCTLDKSLKYGKGCR